MLMSPDIVSDNMIINVGGRTDIVNYYTPWLLNRLSEGYAYSRNPFARENVYKLSLKPEDVDCLLFCSKNYRPMLEHIEVLMKSIIFYVIIRLLHMART